MNPRARLSSLLGFSLIALSLTAKEQKAASTDPKTQMGTIEGHVICEDTRSPARLASVLISPLPVFGASVHSTLGIEIAAKTSLEGDYKLLSIPPGDYFVFAELRGYLSPLDLVRSADLQDPTPESIGRLAKLLPLVHVEPGKTARVDVVIQRGASISGKVTYDDGTPAIGAYIHLDLAQDVPEKDRRFTRGPSANCVECTDARGWYRIDGLPEGEYVVEASIDSPVTKDNPSTDGASEPNSHSVYGQMVATTYAERTLHKKNAKVYKLAPSEDRSGADIEIPLHGLYSISGAVTIQGNQPPIVFGFVSLLDTDDQTFTRTAVIHSDLSFEFSYLPPGKYQLKTADVSDESPTDFTFGQDRKPSYTYPEASTTIQVIDQNLGGITLTIPEATAPPDKPQKTAAPSQNN